MRWRLVVVAVFASALGVVLSPANAACAWALSWGGSVAAADGSGSSGFCGAVLSAHTPGRELVSCVQGSDPLSVAYSVAWPDRSDGVFAYTAVGSADCAAAPGGGGTPPPGEAAAVAEFEGSVLVNVVALLGLTCVFAGGYIGGRLR